MKIKYVLLILFCFQFTALSAQSLEEARSLFSKGEYQKAKPVFERHVKSQPGNANYNYWYGVCCLQTGEAEKSIRYLELASKRKIQSAPFYLGQAYNHVYRFDEAIKSFEEHIDVLTKRKQPAENARKELEKSKVNARMLKGVQEVCVIDSFVINKKNFLEAYKISEEAGRIYTYNEYFNVEGQNEGTVYETELGSKAYYSKIKNNKLQIFSRNKLLDEWGNEAELPASINGEGNTNYPFMLTDGITFYFASDDVHSMGGYDIFATRYNSSTEGYLTPENVGMPFNSLYNDYMYVIDEYNDLGWFATDRFQPEDKVCIYVFIPNTSRQAYNYESMGREQIIRLAQLRSIKDTWKDESVVAEARQRLQEAMKYVPKKNNAYSFIFIINDDLIYYNIEDFKSVQAKALFKQYQQMDKSYKQQTGKLESERDKYAKANENNKRKMAPGILDLEQRVREMEQQLDELQVKVRNEEIKNIKK